MGLAAARSALPDWLLAKRGPYSFIARSSSAAPLISNFTAPGMAQNRTPCPPKSKMLPPSLGPASRSFRMPLFLSIEVIASRSFVANCERLAFNMQIDFR
jgi:hypothetical protein